MDHLGSAAHFAAGAVGDPGNRAFFLEVETEGVRRWFLLEKQQVAALAERMLELARDLDAPPQPPGPDLGPEQEPDFRVGDIGVGIDDANLLIVLEATDDANVGVSFLITPEMADAAARHARTVVASGRPACPLCGRPKDPEGHRCPATNGDLRDADS